MAVLTITSHNHLYRSHHTMSMHKSSVISRQTPSPPSHYLANSSHGTRVSVRDLFGNMPVRVKQRALLAAKPRGNAKEWEELKRLVIALLLCWPKDVTVDIRDIGADQKLFLRSSKVSDQSEVSRACSILLQASYISGHEKDSWVSVGARTPNMEVTGAISLEPNPTKHVQFLSVGIHPLSTFDGQSILHDEINQWFLNSAFGNEANIKNIDDSERVRRAQDKRYRSDGYTSKDLKGGRKGVERWPMFYLNVRMKQQNTTLGSRPLDVDNILDNQGNTLTSVLELLQTMISEFLTRHHFCPKAPRRRFENDLASPDEPQNFGSSLIASNVFASKPRKKQSPTRGRSSKQPPKPDSLETNVKVPSFRRPSSENTAIFDSWSRVKIGNVAREGAVAPKLSPVANLKSISVQRPLTAPPHSRRDTSTLNGTSVASLMRASTTSLISKEGKVIRQPFDDVTVNVPPVDATKAKVSRNELFQDSEPAYDNDDDNVIVWMNPVTRVTSLVNRRTGLTVPVRTAPSTGSLSKTSFPSRLKMQAPFFIDASPSPWISNLLKDWQNPVFCPVENSIPQVSFDDGEEAKQHILHGRHHHCSQLDIDRAFKESSSGWSGRISVEALENAEVISQVDNKFILVKLEVHSQKSIDEDVILVLIDQHAADERIRIEGLLTELFSIPPNGVSLESGIRTELLDKPLVFEVSYKEATLLQEHILHFRGWGILYDLSHSGTASSTATAKDIHRLTVRHLPPGIIERCRSEPRLIIDLIRTEAWKANDKLHEQPVHIQGSWLERVHSCPQGILDMLNSRACRSAIMFNDKLSNEQCHMLVQKLALCRFPFQCAHGRPSLVPLVELGNLGKMRNFTLGEDSQEFGSQYIEWKRSIF